MFPLNILPERPDTNNRIFVGLRVGGGGGCAGCVCMPFPLAWRSHVSRASRAPLQGEGRGRAAYLSGITWLKLKKRSRASLLCHAGWYALTSKRQALEMIKKHPSKNKQDACLFWHKWRKTEDTKTGCGLAGWVTLHEHFGLAW